MNPKDIMRTIGRGLDLDSVRYQDFRERADELRTRYPETTVKGKTPGFYGPLNRSLEEELSWKTMHTGLPYGVPRGAVLKRQLNEAKSRTKRMTILIDTYKDMRETGLSHNETMDRMVEITGKTPEFREFEGIFTRHYVGNRGGPGDLNDPVDREDFKKKGADISRTIKENEPPSYLRHRRNAWDLKEY